MSIEVLRAVHIGEVVDGVHARDGTCHATRIPHIADDHLEFVGHIAQPTLCAARVIVKNSHAMAVAQQPANEGSPDESGPAGHETKAVAHRPSAPQDGRNIYQPARYY